MGMTSPSGLRSDGEDHHVPLGFRAIGERHETTAPAQTLEHDLALVRRHRRERERPARPRPDPFMPP